MCGVKSVVMEDISSTFKTGTKTTPNVQLGVVTAAHKSRPSSL